MRRSATRPPAARRKQPVSVILNSGGGTIAAGPEIPKTLRESLRKAGIAFKLEMIDGAKCEARCRAIAKRGDPLVIVGGGDGTISAAATALIGTVTSLGILPLGTLNHFARDLGIPSDLGKAVALIAEGKQRRVDVAELNGRIFINNSAVGLYPLMVLDRETQQKRLGRSKRLAMIVASARTLARFKHHRLTLTVNDDQAEVDTPLLFVGNNNYRIDLGGAGTRDSIEDGKLFVLVMRKTTRMSFIASSIRALFNRARPDDMKQLDDVDRLSVTSRRSRLAVSLDGEVESIDCPLDYRLHKKALKVIAP